MQISTHQYLLTAAWGPLINIAIILNRFKHYKLFTYAHYLIGLLIIIQTYLGPISIIMEHGLNLYNPTWHQMVHNIFGFMMLLIIGFQGLFGILAKINQIKRVSSSRYQNLAKVSHKYLGFTLILLAKLVYLQSYIYYWLFQPLLILQILTIGIYLCFKLIQSPLSPKFFKQQKDHIGLKIVKCIQEIGQKREYIIFANEIYDASQLEKYHPGGAFIINYLRGREIDRFVYGGQAPQNDVNLRHKHSNNVLKLLRNPIGIIQIRSPYANMKDLNQCEIKQVFQMKNQKTYLINVVLKNCHPVFQGYTRLQQFGYYYSLTLNDNTTRLYTGVNCLRDQNKKKMLSIINSQVLNKQIQDMNQAHILKMQDSSIIKSQILENSSMCSKITSQTSQNYKQKTLIPLLIKKYEKGLLTSKIFNYKNEHEILKSKYILLSCPRGQGLKLTTLQKGKIVFLAGGTGLFPFIDLIDILFKANLMKKQNSRSTQLIKSDSVLENSNFFNNFEFVLLLAIHNLADIHPLTLYQINQLCDINNCIKFACKIKCENDIQKINKKYPNLNQCQNIISTTIDQSKVQNLSRIYICGPAKLQQQALQELQRQDICQQKYQIV